jgi:hypothetical protein
MLVKPSKKGSFMGSTPRKSSANSESSAPTKPCDFDLQKVGEELISSYKMLEDVWNKAESLLSLAHVPQNVMVKVNTGYLEDEESGPYGEWVQYLAYVKLKSQWRICVIQQTDHYDRPDYNHEHTPITECSVDIRLEMIEWFPKLREEVIKVTKSFVPKIKNKVAEFEALLEVLDI